MIELINVSKYYPTDFGRHYVFRDVSLVLPPDKSVGVLGPNGAGKSTFLRLIGGADIPSEGTILRTGRISPPMGLTPGLQSSLTGSENARFAGRICGLPREEINGIIEYVRELANIGKYFDMPVSSYSAGMKQRVSFAINMSMNFDYYLFDEIAAGGDKEFRKITKTMVQERLKTSKFVIASHRVDELLDICDSGIVIQNGELTFYDDIKDALEVYGGDDEQEDRRARRARRRGLDIDLADEGTLEVAPERSAEGTAEDEERKARREQRRLKRKMAMEADEATTVEEPVAEPPIASATGEEDEERKARREQRRLKRKMAMEADEATTVEEPVAETPVASAADDDEERKARREQRRQKRKMMMEAAGETAVEELAAEPPVASAADDDEERKARREQRRLKREMKKAAVQEDEPPSETMIEAPGPPPRIEVIPTPQAPVQAPVSIKPAPPVGMAPMAQRARPAPPMPPPIAPAPPPAAPALQRVPGVSFARSLAIQRALLRQERAQTTAARAARLLLEHLEAQARTGNATAPTRAWLIAAAQETAALEAAQAREMLENTLSSGEPAIASGAPSNTPAANLLPSASSETRHDVLRRLVRTMANPD
jgi:capsular polysaccharide transport system ATP-binding protein